MNRSAVTNACPRIIATAAEALAWIRAQRHAGKSVGLVPTMGALHTGHLSLIERSQQECDCTVVSIFVNPMQFGPHEDFNKYPRPLTADLEKLAAAGVELVFVPTVDEMYPAGFNTHVDPGALGQTWEGAFRPGHFRGVLTIVLKLFEMLPADRAYFGQKDFQQTVVVRQMVADLNLPIEIVICPTIRDNDGLALSSRNAFLDAPQRKSALSISRGLRLAKEQFAAGQRDAAQLGELVRQTIATEPGLEIQYVAVVDPISLAELSQVT
ncbi:MAG TPA: pantoate--beta-alanine ligase, partial [Pirellulales bacterium]